MKTELILQLAGLAHVGILVAGACMPRVTGLRPQLRSLAEFPRQLFWVYFGVTGFCIIAFGIISFVFADELASGTPLARAFCFLVGSFWLLRCGVACFVFDLRPFLTSTVRRVGHALLNLTFALLTLVYLWVAIFGGPL